MNFKYKFQILIYPFIIFPVILIILINFFVNASKTKYMQYEILENHLNNIISICETENDIIKRLKMNENQYYSDAVMRKVLSEISMHQNQNEKTLIIKSKTKRLVYFTGLKNDLKEKSLTNIKYVDEMIKKKHGRIEFTEQIDEESEKMSIATYKYYPEWDWLIAVSLSKDNLYKYVYSSTYLSLIIAAIFLIILFIISYIISLGISKPLEQLEEGTIKIAKNDYDVNIEIKSSDEFGNIAKKFNIMAYKIKEYSIKNSQIIGDLEESENRFRRLAENAKDIIYRMSLKDGRYEYISKAAENITGYKVDDFYNNQFFIKEIIHPDWLNYFKEEWDKIIQGSISPHYEYKIIDKSGNEKWLSQRNVLINDENGNPIAIEGIVTDITDRKHTEEDIRHERTLLKRITETSPIGITLVNPDGIITFANNQAEEILGLTKDEITERTYNASEWRITDLEGETFPNEKLPFNQIMIGKKPVYDIQHAIEWPNGHRIYLSINGAPLLDQDGNIESIVFSIEDITKKKQSEQALKKSEKRFRMAQAIGHVGNWEYNLKTMEFWGSDEAKRIYGFDPKQENFTTDEVEKCIPERERVHQALVDLIEKDKAYNLEFEIHPLNSSKPKIIMSIAELITDENGKPFKVIGVIQDITERKQAEQEILKLNQVLEKRVKERTIQLEIINKELEAFAYSVSHDLKTPLRSIYGFSQILFEEYSNNIDAQGKDYLQRVRSAAERMGQIIDDMLNLSRVTRNEMVIQSVNLSILIKEIADVFCKSQSERSVDIVIEPDIIVNGDANLLRIALENLFGNAWKFTSHHNKAQIEFGMQKQHNKAVYFIKDDGAGFDSSHSKNLFSPFERLHASKEFEGTGIGLAIVKRIIDRHGGKIWAEGEIEKGSTFYFTIPLKK